MKKKILFLVVLVFILSGCGSKTSKEAVGTSNKNAASSTKTENKEKTSNNLQTKTNVENSTSTKNPVKLSEKQKSEVNNKLGSAIDNINSSLNSLDDATDVNLDSVN